MLGGELASANKGCGGVQMRTSALFGARNVGFSKFMVYPHG